MTEALFIFGLLIVMGFLVILGMIYSQKTMFGQTEEMKAYWGTGKMIFKVQVGTTEKHEIQFNHSMLLGTLTVLVDGQTVPIEGTGQFTTTLTTVRTLMIGNAEKHEARIVLTRPLFFSALRKWKYQLFTDNQLVHECTS